ncbi:hypothetical protein IFO70_24920 [Phormidium tenue FACHB-886]|nr:hypothetical protein [Phormidium tenue FACHB-886]
MKTSTRRLKAVYPYWVIGKIAVLLLIRYVWLHLVEMVRRGWMFKRAQIKQKPKELLYTFNEPVGLRDDCNSNYSIAISASTTVVD